MSVAEPRTRPGSIGVASLLRRKIIRGDIQLHDRLPSERMLASEHLVSRGTIREALNRLERENLIEIRRGSGAYVIHTGEPASDSPIESAGPLELIDARFALEPHICRLAVLHCRTADFEKLDLLLDKMEANAEDPTVFSQADSEFHSTLAQTTGNSLLIWIIAQINSVRAQDQWTRMLHLTLEPQIITDYNRQHRNIVDAIRRREPENAAKYMKDHLETARLSLTRAAAT